MLHDVSFRINKTWYPRLQLHFFTQSKEYATWCTNIAPCSMFPSFILRLTHQQSREHDLRAYIHDCYHGNAKHNPPGDTTERKHTCRNAVKAGKWGIIHGFKLPDQLEEVFKFVKNSTIRWFSIGGISELIWVCRFVSVTCLIQPWGFQSCICMINLVTLKIALVILPTIRLLNVTVSNTLI